MSALFEFLIVLTTAIVLVMYLGCVAAAVRLIGRGRMPATTGFKMILALAAIYSIWTIYGAGWEALGWGSALLILGLPVYWLMNARGSKPTV